MAVTVAELAAQAVTALAALAEVAEPIDDEAQYVADLVTVWGARLRAIGTAATDTGRATPDGASTAIERLTDEVDRITDPHRAIDWLSTFPQAAILALGDTP